ncbi:MAG: enoyl-ACP reductase FabI [Janthinobacterium lividum]
MLPRSIHWGTIENMGILDGKQGIIYGVRNERSLGWGCAQSLTREGARLAYSVMSEREEKDVLKLSSSLGEASTAFVQICDLTKDEDIDALHVRLAAEMGHLDFVIHAAAFSPKDGISGRFLDVSRASFQTAVEASTYSFVAAAKSAEPLMGQGGSLLTLSYLGAERVIPNYNTMGVAKAALESSVRYLASDLGPSGIRVNAISAGPTMTLSARGIAGFTDMHREVREVAPLRKNTTPDEVGDAAAFLVSEWARGITGEVIYVDNGLHILG